MKTKYKVLIFVLFFLLTMSVARMMVLIESKDVLEDMIVEQKKTISLYKKFMNEITHYVETKQKDTVLLDTLISIQDYMEVYATPQQKGRSSNFHKEIQETLQNDIERKEDEQE